MDEMSSFFTLYLSDVHMTQHILDKKMPEFGG